MTRLGNQLIKLVALESHQNGNEGLVIALILDKSTLPQSVDEVEALAAIRALLFAKDIGASSIILEDSASGIDGHDSMFPLIRVKTRALFPATMTEMRSISYIYESIASLKSTSDHHAHSLQEITQQLNAISLILQKLTEAKEKRQQPPSPKSSPISHAVTLPLPSLSKSARLEFPRFKRDDPAAWVYKANQYCNFYHTPLNERLLMASFHMDAGALIWFQDCEATGVLVARESFVEALLIRIGSSAYEDPMEALTRLRQTSNVVNYKGQFEAPSNRIRDLSEDHKLSCFFSGLKDEVRLPVKMLNPKNLNEAFGLAKIHEEYLMCSKKSQKLSSSELYKPSILGPRPDVKLDSKFKLPL
ncbi:hypothetical protein SO802_010040 [Lithocarpus litseifolius]|uniref:Uncharacterized protein n=1 Tax=Lithocarpus litseifolius TaxID=425828 RepID=A0AAW2DD68_9ROSI